MTRNPKPRRRGAKVRKPRELQTWATSWRAFEAKARFDVVAQFQGHFDRGALDARECRRLAAWLIRFADWAESRRETR